MMDMEADWNVWSSADQQYAPMSSHADSVAFVDSNTATPFAGLSYPFASEDSYSAAPATNFQGSQEFYGPVYTGPFLHVYPAHHIPPGCYSHYSSLAVNLEYMERLKASPSQSTSKIHVDAAGPFQYSESLTQISSANTLESTTVHEAPLPHLLPLKPILPASPSTKRRREVILTEDQCSSPTSIQSHSPSPSFQGRVDLSSTSNAGLLITTPTSMKRNVKEPRRPSLACNFCRERKIGCGRPPEEAPDRTCNQCERRGYVCVYTPLRHKRRAPTKGVAKRTSRLSGKSQSKKTRQAGEGAKV